MIGGVSSVRGLAVMIATEGIFCLARCNAHERVQALPTMPRHGVNTVDAPLQERVKSRKNYIVFISVIGNPLKVDILLSRATYSNFLCMRFEGKVGRHAGTPRQ
jgi:hypothetical protein